MADMRLHVCVISIHTYIHTYIHTDIHTDIRTYLHTQTSRLCYMCGLGPRVTKRVVRRINQSVNPDPDGTKKEDDFRTPCGTPTSAWQSSA